MFITLRDVSKGKPLSLNKSIENCKQIGIRTIFMWVGWYNIYKEQSWRWAKETEPRNSTEVKIQPGLYSFRVWPHGDRRLYRLGIKVDYGGMDERYAMNKTIASRLNDPCSVIAALR